MAAVGSASAHIWIEGPEEMQAKVAVRWLDVWSRIRSPQLALR